MLLNTKFQNRVDFYVKSDIVGQIADMAELTAALKCANQFNLKKIEDRIIEEIIYELSYVIDDDESTDSFKSLPFNLIRSIFLFDLSGLCPFRLPSTKRSFDSFVIW